MEGPVPTTILAVAAHACQQLCRSVSSDRGADSTKTDLIWAMHAFLVQLVGSPPTPHASTHPILARVPAAPWFRPTLDQAVSLASVMCEGHTTLDSCAPTSPQSDLREAWHALTALSLRALLAVVTGHPTPKKVYQSIVPTLGLQLMVLAAPAHPSGPALQATALSTGGREEEHGLLHAGTSGAGGGGGGAETTGSDLGWQVQAGARALLVAVVLDDAHVPGLAQVAHQLASPLISKQQQQQGRQGPAGAAASAEVEGEQEAGSSEATTGEVKVVGGAPAANRSYQAALVHAIEAGLKGVTTRGHVLSALPWFLGAWCTAMVRHRRLVASDAGAASRQALRSSSRGGDGDGGDDLGASPDAAAAALQGTEFNLLVVLSHMLLASLGAAAQAGRAAQADGGDVGGTDGEAPGQGSAETSKKKRKKGQQQQQEQQEVAVEAVVGGGAGSSVEQAAVVMYGLAALMAAAKVGGVAAPVKHVY